MKPFSKPLLLLLAVLMAGTAVHAQQAPKRVYNLQEAIAHALENNASVKNERINEGIATAQVKETVAEGLPQINVAGNLTYNIQRQVSFLPGDFIGQPGTFVPVAFGTPYTSNAGATLSQLIFNGSYFVGLQASKVYKELAAKNLEKAKIEVAEAVALAYYGALVSEERLELLAVNMGRLDTLYRETKAMNENGFAEAIDVQRVQVNLNNLRTEYQNVERSMAINLNVLKFQMGIPVDQEIELAENISDYKLEDIAFAEDVPYSQRIEYQQLNINRELARLDIKNTRMQYLPNLSVFANAGYTAGRTTFGEFFEPTVLRSENENGEVIEQVVDTWNPYAAVGLNLNIPVFDGFLKANTIRRKKLIADQVDIQIQNLENSINLEIEQAQVNLRNSLQSLETQQENIELAQEVFRVSSIKYQEGIGSNLEVIEAENALKTAETNYYQALYNALVARVAYNKATGTLLQK
ncbi:TolC family protein [Cesiribacter sp. SM1]|uniref:TolC family protein n=1 Tax=Cesiribacter sp. SM1 TaxID=2861196 RepID=UPI001CD21C6D|nr:TolC family protein [Cesiribacter sp. SM1]